MYRCRQRDHNQWRTATGRSHRSSGQTAIVFNQPCTRGAGLSYYFPHWSMPRASRRLSTSGNCVLLIKVSFLSHGYVLCVV
ncbi:hypothetical protein FKM82_023054 [Ascaphus truei]